MVQTIPFMEFTPGKYKKKGGGPLGGILKTIGSVVGSAIGFVAGGPPGAVVGFKVGQTAGETVGKLAEGDVAGAAETGIGVAGDFLEGKVAAQVAGDVPAGDIDKRIGEAYGLFEGAPSLGQYMHGGWGQQPTYGFRPRRQ